MRMWKVVPALLSRRRETNFIIVCNPVPSTSTNVWTHQFSFAWVQYYVNYNYYIQGLLRGKNHA
jgi:hypothetical protein